MNLKDILQPTNPLMPETYEALRVKSDQSSRTSRPSTTRETIDLLESEEDEASLAGHPCVSMHPPLQRSSRNIRPRANDQNRLRNASARRKSKSSRERMQKKYASCPSTLLRSKVAGVKSKVCLTNQINVPTLPGGYELLLLIDHREKKCSLRPNQFRDQLIKMGIPVAIKQLPLGDALWVARPIGSEDESEWIIVGYIIERKQLNDLAESIKEGRLKEQRTRLNSSGIANITIILEGQPKSGQNMDTFDRTSIRESALATTIAKLDAAFGFNIHKTQEARDTLWVLAQMTRTIALKLSNWKTFESEWVCKEEREAEQKLIQALITRTPVSNNSNSCESEDKAPDARGMPYSVWKVRMKKTKDVDMTVGRIFGRQLRMIKGNSADKVSAILQNHETALSLTEAYAGCGNIDEERGLFSQVRWGVSSRKFGQAQSEQIQKFFRQVRYDDS
mmetsp:Transcript_21964/g.30647  ORF Transcript_21964/g.30647 Transcript_21964/m.30647 type:complete len:449 (+) Transcript_21964:221-1567(+)